MCVCCRSFYELLDELVANETWTVEENRDAKVLGMAPELFLNIKVPPPQLQALLTHKLNV